jgi:hypothetical protein
MGVERGTSERPVKAPSEGVMKLLRKMGDWVTVCPKCKIKLTGTIQEIQSHAH